MLGKRIGKGRIQQIRGGKTLSVSSSSLDWRERKRARDRRLGQGLKDLKGS